MFKRLFKWLIRTVVIVVILFAIAMVADYSSHRVAPDSVLVLELDGPTVERGGAGVFGLLASASQTPLNVVRRALKMAAVDPRITGLAIKIIDPDMELAQAQELIDMVADFKHHGKWTAAYIETAGETGAGNLPYMVASATDHVSLMPQGELNLLGVQIREMFARGLFDWIKVNPNFASFGQYKDAANIFTEKDFTAAQREEDTALVGSMYGQLVDTVARNRKIDPAAFRALMDQAPLSAQAGLKAHLVDQLEYEDQFDARMKSYGGHTHALVDYDAYARPHLLPSRIPDKIAVIYGLGAIQRGAGGYDPVLSPGGTAMGSDDIDEAFKSAREDDSVRAVVFRIDSPGGSVIASELIRRQVELTAAKKPVVVSMSGFGASGGYWVSTAANRIIADPGTITGSIGVLGGKFNIAPMAQALGVNSGAISLGANAGMFDAFTDFTPAQQQIFRDQILGDTYQYFLRLVAAQRRMTVDQVNQIAQGRVWSGEQALQVKLVDKLGDFDTAFAEAKALAKLGPAQPVEVVELPAQPGLFEKLFSAQAYSEASMATEIPRVMRPLMAILHAALARSGAYGEVYCPLRPVM